MPRRGLAMNSVRFGGEGRGRGVELRDGLACRGWRRSRGERERGGGVAEEASAAGGERFAEAADEALAGGGVGDAAGQAGGDGGLVVGGADVASIHADDECDGRQREGGIGGGAEFLGANVLQAGEGFGCARRR